MIQYADEGSIHLDLYEADTVRIAAYRYYQMFSKMPVPTTAIVLHALTKDEVEGRSGRISNMDEIDQFFKKKVAVSALFWFIFLIIMTTWLDGVMLVISSSFFHLFLIIHYY